MFSPDDREAFRTDTVGLEFRSRLGGAGLQPTSSPVSQQSPPVVIHQSVVVSSGPPLGSKSPGLAAVLSALMPGLGQIYNGQIGKGIGMIVLQAINVLLMFIIIGFFTGLAVWIWSMLDAHQEAQRINMRLTGESPGPPAW